MPRIRPWIRAGRGSGASLFRDKCVRVGLQHVAKVPLADYDNMVNTLPSDRADQPFRTSVLPRQARRGRSISYAHRPGTPD